MSSKVSQRSLMSAIAPVRPPRLTARAALPGALLLVLFGLAVLLSLAAPGRGDDGQIYAVSINNGQDDWVYIPRASLECARDGQVSTCSVEVANRRLEVSMHYSASESRGISCRSATYDGKSVRCSATYAYTATGVGAVALLTEGLDLTAAERDLVAEGRPWWSQPDNVVAVIPYVILALALAAAAVAGFGSRAPVDNARVLLIGTGVGWLVLLVASPLLLGGDILMLLPGVFVIGPLLVLWQHRLAAPGRARAIWRAAEALVVTGFVSAAALWLFQLGAAYID
ncbi:hypothetical protein Aglo03_61870 [Actinokineospora globicatena]|uniref:Uncharacterized protein n=2 Tax=Actinokineospora globicatena TaxID=103729 RepID=A0A9W6QR42_9PSEU|nr:hypothetical protein Aglo03_61870 [Actinokineospora globicatena]